MTWWWLVVLGLHATVPVDTLDPCSGDLVSLDHARAAAFAAGDPALLERVYVARSPLRNADARSIAGYRDRGGQVMGALLEIARCRTLHRGAEEVQLEVVDALGPAFVRWDDGSTTVLPADRPTRRWVTLQMTPDGWRISGSRSPERR